MSHKSSFYTDLYPELYDYCDKDLIYLFDYNNLKFYFNLFKKAIYCIDHVNEKANFLLIYEIQNWEMYPALKNMNRKHYNLYLKGYNLSKKYINLL